MLFINHYLPRILAAGLLLIAAGCQGIVSPPPDAHETRLRNAIRINPIHELGYIRLAQYLESRQRYAETFSVLREAQQHIPDSIKLIRLEGRLFQGLGRFREAENFYTEHINKHPDNPMLLLDRAQMYWRIDNQQLALDDAGKALSLNADLFEAHYLIGVILGRKTVPDDPEKSEQALEALITASQINSMNPDIWLRISDLWERQREPEKALQAMLRAVELAPESKLYLRRYTVMQEKELDQATQNNSEIIAESLHKTLKHMLKLFPEDSWVQAHYGNWAWTQDKYALAEKHLGRSLELKSPYPWASFRLGVVFISQEKWESALESFEEGLKNDPENAWAIQQTAFVLEKLEKNQQAISRYEWLMENAPANLYVVNRLNQVYWDEFLFEKGENTLLRGLEKFPVQSELTDKLLEYYESRRLFEKGAEILKPFVEAKPGNTAALAKLGFYQNSMKRPEKALFWFNKALESSPDFEWARVQQVRIFLNAQQTEKAESELNSFLKLNPDAEWALLELSKLKMKEEQYDEAESLLQKGLIKYPDSLALLETQGRLFELQERWDDAENNFHRLVSLRPNNSLMLTYLGFTQWKQKKQKLAVQNITRALYENPGGLWAWFLYLLLQPEEQQRRWIGEELQQLRPALDALASRTTEKAWYEITRARTDPFTRQVLKNLHFLLAEAPEEIKMEPEDMSSKQLPPWIHEQWGFFHEILGNNQLAVLHYEAVLAALPDNDWIHSRLGWIYERLEKLEKSKLHYSRFLNKHPKALDVSFRLANVFTLLGDEASTIKLYKKIIAERPDHDLVLNNLAWLYLTAEDRRLRDVEKGMELARKSVELNPTIDNLDTLAEAYFQSGEQNKAIEVIRKAAREVDYPVERHSYLRKQLLRFRKGEPNISPPALT